MRFILLFISVILTNLLFGQEKDSVETITVRKKIEFTLYRGVLKETENWYLILDSDKKYYLINVVIPANDVIDWFKRFKESQNIYKSFLEIGAYPVLNFRKENDPGEYLTFYLNGQNENSISLTLIETNTPYKFSLLQKFTN
jgi:hypothetical protein